MPELPEVEAVKSGLAEILTPNSEIIAVELLSPALRTRIPPKIKKDLIGQKLASMRRRAKYILFELNDWTLISHLGMTGSWRVLEEGESLIIHDHFSLTFQNPQGRKPDLRHAPKKIRLVYNDPRRFGVIDYEQNKSIEQNQWLKHLGVEPLTEDFSVEYLKARAKDKKSSVKAFIMDQKHVVGVGNIYASEALYLAQIKPKRPAYKITAQEWVHLVKAIKETLNKSIQSGGTTLKDYRQVSGEKGGYQTQLLVYDRQDEKCYRCSKGKLDSTIRMAVIVGRSTYWCNTCQK